MSVVEITPWQLFVLGGVWMWPILLCSVFAMALIIERIMFFLAVERSIRILEEKTVGAISRGDLKKAVAACDSVESPLSPILKAGIFRFSQGKMEIQEVMEETSSVQVPLLEKGIPFLSAVGSALPLVGFLGTVTGLASAARSFQVHAEAMNPATLADIAQKVSSALVPTGLSLFVTFFVIVAYYYLAGRVRDIVRDMERVSMKVATALADFSGDRAEEKGEE